MLQNMKIGKRLGLGFGVVLLIMMLLSGFSYLSTIQLDALIDDILQTDAKGVEYAQRIRANLLQLRRFEKDLFINIDSPAKVADYRKQWDEALVRFTGRVENMNAVLAKVDYDAKQEKGFAAEISTNANAYAAGFRKVTDQITSGNIKSTSDANKAITEFKDNAHKAEELTGELTKVMDARLAEMNKVVNVKVRHMKLLIPALMATALMLGIIIATFLTRSLTRPISEAVSVAHSLAGGDLSITVESKSKDETGQMMEAIRTMVVKLRQVVGDVMSATDNVASGSQQLSATAQQLSLGASGQAASAEEISSSMEEMASSIRQNADNSGQTEKIAIKSAAVAREGGQAVSETVAAMKEIASKIGIIEEIARQTNLLALNAAIEAARAGEHGKGFAVVAGEVRKLAERSQTAAAEINSLSSRSVQVAETAGEMLTRMVPDIQKTAELVQEISASCHEQDTGTDQINRAIQQLDMVIQQNASASEEMASTSDELSNQAEQLKSTIGFFTVDAGAMRQSPRVRAALPHYNSPMATIGRKKEGGQVKKPGDNCVHIQLGELIGPEHDEEEYVYCRDRS